MRYILLEDRLTGQRHPILFTEAVGDSIQFTDDRFELISSGEISIDKVSVQEGTKGDELDIIAFDHFARLQPNQVN